MPDRRLRRWLAWAMDREQARRAPFLSHSPLFAGLPRRMLGRLATRFLEKAYYPGEFVFHETDPGRALFVVVEGTVEIIQTTPRGEHVVRTLVAGDQFGELALIDESPRSGSARIGEQARLLILYKSDFDGWEGEAGSAMVSCAQRASESGVHTAGTGGLTEGPRQPGRAAQP